MHAIPTTLNCRGILLDLSVPKVMGILNVTDDSFYDGGQYLSKYQVLRQVEKMITEGVDIIDVGGMSSRPGALEIDESVEMDRVISAIRWIKEANDQVILSIDTYRSSVMRAALREGAHMLNDISGFKFDAQLLETISGRQVPYILMHMQAIPQNMQDNPTYVDLVKDILAFMVEKLRIIEQLDIPDVVVDPGFGFGKTLEDNYRLLDNLSVFQLLNCPILVGISRKSMIYKLLDIGPREALSATAALHMVALQNGASILRAHDVKEARQVITLWNQLNQNQYEN